MFTGMDGNVCGYEFEVGSDYIVYASMNRNDGGLLTSIGYRTQPIDTATEDRTAFGDGAVPTSALPIQEQLDSARFRLGEEVVQEEEPPFPLLVGIGAAIAGSVGFIVLRRRK